MASPLVEAVKHFPLPQLMADPNLCRNVLNDIGAQPAEVFLLVAALEARVPQTLMEHKATNDLSVVEPRLVAELNQRGIERGRAEWAVNAWKDVVSGSPLEQKTVIRQTEPVVAATQPVSQSPTTPVRRSGRRRNLVVAAVIGILIVAGVAAWLAWPDSKRNAAGTNSTSPAADRNTASAANLTAPLGPGKDVSVAAATAWTDTGLKVTKGERVDIAVTGQIGYGRDLVCGPDGARRKAPDTNSIIGGQHAAVIGLVGGSGTPFLVGADYNGVAPATGRLWLGINDVVLTDNSGHFTATVRLQQP